MHEMFSHMEHEFLMRVQNRGEMNDVIFVVLGQEFPICICGS